MARHLGHMLRTAVFALAFCSLALPALAAGVVRDPDIERALKEIAKPLITAAGLSPAQIKVLVVDDPNLNAFVVDSRHILIHSGLILKTKRAEELQAVIAHEVAHIANGHLSRRLTNLGTANTAARFGLLLALAVGAATGHPEAAAGVAIGTGSSATRVFLKHTRAEESSADQAALRYMAMRGIDPTAMADVLEYFRGQEVLSEYRQDPYVRTHPLSRDRIRAVEGYAAAYKDRAQENPAANYWFLRAQGKLSAFTRSPGWTLNRVRNDNSELGLMRQAIAYHRSSDKAKALTAINRLLAMKPGDPYYLELKGQIQLESRDFGGAANSYGAAANAAPSEPLILAGYGRALVAIGRHGEALGVLERARARDGTDPRMLRDLAVAYAKTGNNGMASLVTAERYAVLGNLKTAAIHAERAVGLLPRGSRGWNRAQDVLSAARAAGIERG
ncbi:M48 family metalloprotease [Psychromarinibacter sp. C21-152]|uniref:M48 family metalloprotease n=1 Tax=Psychromarinibacter sediminicola TaxID=3033385 RepID=A0AAE3T8G8_9RHOB|nr:M48 family metalloprotease [Psychromarinibacter sediminicola]MDF0600054.1 M48 family metalloprotease [Psychromarinibacter sediminicola]